MLRRGIEVIVGAALAVVVLFAVVPAVAQAQEEGGANQEAQAREQRCYGMTQRAGLMPVPSGVDDFKRVERWMADLYGQHHKAEENEQQTPQRPMPSRGPRWMCG
jgi:hypothetical protein